MRKMRFISIVLISSILAIAAIDDTYSADMSERFQARVHKSGSFSSLPYRLLIPNNYDKAKKYPLVLFLHGSDERGNDNKKHLYSGLDIFAYEKRMDQSPCFIVAPQCPADTKWAEVDWKADRHTMQKKPTPALAMAIELIIELQKEFSIDSRRLYITGYSMGGFGTWEAIQRWPNLFAAAVPVCGGGDEAQARRIANIPTWAFHGALDTLVKVTRSRDMINAVVMAGGIPRYTEYSIINHLCWGFTYGDEDMFRWLLKQKK